MKSITYTMPSNCRSVTKDLILKIIRSSFFLGLVITLSTVSLSAQKVKDLVTIRTLNKAYFSGEIYAIDSNVIILIDENGEKISIDRNNIKSMSKGIYTGKSRLTESEPFFTPTGRVNRKGNHFYKNYYIFGNHFGFAMSDHIELSAGFETASILANGGNTLPVMHAGFKVGGNLNNDVNVALSIRSYFNDEGGVGLIGIPLTFGKRTSITLAPTYAINSSDDAITMLFYNFTLPISTKVRIVADGLLVEDGNALAIMLEIGFSRFSLSPGVVSVIGEGYAPALAFSIPFGG